MCHVTYIKITTFFYFKNKAQNNDKQKMTTMVSQPEPANNFTITVDRIIAETITPTSVIDSRTKQNRLNPIDDNRQNTTTYGSLVESFKDNNDTKYGNGKSLNLIRFWIWSCISFYVYID